MVFKAFTTVRAPDFPAGLTWLSSEPLSLAKLRGKPVLIDIFTYSCINCRRTFPHLQRWHETYAKHGLTIIGVHTPEFTFEKDESRVKQALREAGISYPVVLDPDYKIWHAYANRYWPRKFLIDREGKVVYDHAGEGAYAETEFAIQKELKAMGVKDLPAIGPDDSIGGRVCYRTTPEMYLGYLRGRLGNKEDFYPEAETAFTDPLKHEDDVVYLHGHFNVYGEYLEHARKLSAPHEYLRIKYSAFSVNGVFGSANGATSLVELELDGKPLSSDFAGDDVVITSEGKAELLVRDHRMYSLVRAGVHHHGVLTMRVLSGNLQAYSLTFGSCEE